MNFIQLSHLYVIADLSFPFGLYFGCNCQVWWRCNAKDEVIESSEGREKEDEDGW